MEEVFSAGFLTMLKAVLLCFNILIVLVLTIGCIQAIFEIKRFGLQCEQERLKKKETGDLQKDMLKMIFRFALCTALTFAWQFTKSTASPIVGLFAILFFWAAALSWAIFLINIFFVDILYVLFAYLHTRMNKGKNEAGKRM